jgi:hypothetical protein
MSQQTAQALVGGTGSTGGASAALNEGQVGQQSLIGSLTTGTTRLDDLSKIAKWGGIRWPATRTCTPTISGTTTDADGDGLPVNATFTYNSCTNASGDTVSGSYTLKDDDDTKAWPLAGGSLTISNLTFTLANTTGGGATIKVNANVSMHVGTTTLVNKAAVAFDVTTSNVAGTFKYFMNATTTPTSMSQPSAAGSVDLNGFLVISANGNSLTASVAGTGVTYSNACQNYFNNGVITFKDGAGNTLTYTFTNCTVAKAYNATPLT